MTAQLVFQVQIRSGKEKMQAGFCGRFEAAQRRIYIFLARAGERRYAAMLDFGGYGARRFEIAGRGDRETRFENVHAEFFDLPGELQLLLPVHRETGRLLAVTQRRIEDLNRVHGNSFHSASEPRTAQESNL